MVALLGPGTGKETAPQPSQIKIKIGRKEEDTVNVANPGANPNRTRNIGRNSNRVK